MNLEKINFQGTVTAILLSTADSKLETRRIDSLSVGFEGFPGDRHYGFLKSAGGRDKPFYTRGTTIKNHRHWSAVSVEELSKIADLMGISELQPEWIGANLIFKGIPNFTKLPPLSRIAIGRELVLVVYEENLPCDLPLPYIESGAGRKPKMGFAKAGKDRRGLVGWIEREGKIKTGDDVHVYIPKL